MRALVASLVAALLLPAAATAQKAPGLALTPPMGWNSWNRYGCQIDQKLIEQTADAMVSSGLRDAGYVYVNIDDCWQGTRDGHGDIQPDAARFPGGMKALGDYLHQRGLKFGIYSDAGAETCAGRPGSQGHEFQDAAQYARWGVDYVKYDWCNVGDGAAQRNPREAYATISAALAASGRPMVLSICEWGRSDPWLWAGDYGHLWRTTGDITNCWDCVVGHGNWFASGVLPILDQQDAIRGYAGPGRWNDPDMLEVGNLPTLNDDRSHFAMWTMLAAPLIVGTDVAALGPEARAVLANPRLVAIDQDALGIEAFKWIARPGLDVWARPLSGGRWAVALLNRGDTPKDARIDWAAVSLEDNLKGKRADLASTRYRLTDAWTGQAAGTTAAPLERTLAPHDTLVFTLDPTSQGS
jgi:alpha-galactosidase